MFAAVWRHPCPCPKWGHVQVSSQGRQGRGSPVSEKLRGETRCDKGNGDISSTAWAGERHNQGDQRRGAAWVGPMSSTGAFPRSNVPQVTPSPHTPPVPTAAQSTQGTWALALGLLHTPWDESGTSPNAAQAQSARGGMERGDLVPGGLQHSPAMDRPSQSQRVLTQPSYSPKPHLCSSPWKGSQTQEGQKLPLPSSTALLPHGNHLLRVPGARKEVLSSTHRHRTGSTRGAVASGQRRRQNPAKVEPEQAQVQKGANCQPSAALPRAGEG